MILQRYRSMYLGFLLIAFMLCSSVAMAQNDWVSFVNEARAAVEDENYESAVELYTASLSHVPNDYKNTEDHAWLYLDIGACYGQLDNSIEEEKNYDYALEIALGIPDDVPLLLGSIYNHLGVFNARRQHEEKAISSYKLAIPYLKTAGYMSRRNALMAMSNLINSYLVLDNKDMALETMRAYYVYVDESLYSRPDISMTLYEFGNFAKAQKDYELAKQFYDELADIGRGKKPGNDFIHYNLAKFLTAEMDRKLGNYWSAIYDLGLAADYVKHYYSEADSRLLGIYRLLALVHGDYYEPDQSVIYYNKVLDLLALHQPEDIAIKEQITMQLRINMSLAGDFRGALQLELKELNTKIERLDSTKIETLEMYLDVAQIHIDLQEYRAALNVIKDLTNHPKYNQLEETKSTKIYHIMGMIALKLERLKNAEVFFLDIIENSKDLEYDMVSTVDALNGLGEIYMKLGNYNKSKKYYETVIESSYNNLGYDFEYEKKTAAIGLADIYLHEKHYDKAITILNTWVYRKSTIPHNHFYKGKNFMQGRLFTKLAESYLKNSERNQAIVANDSALIFKKKSHSEDHLEFVPNLMISAKVASLQLQFDTAQQIITDIKALQKKQLDENSLDVMNTLLLSQQIAIANNNSALMQTNARVLKDALLIFTNTIFEFKSEEEKKLLIENTINPIKNILIESAVILMDSAYSINTIAFEITQFYNGIILSRSKNILNKLQTLEEDVVNNSIDYVAELKLKRVEKIAANAPKDEIAQITTSLREFESKLNELYYIKFPTEKKPSNLYSEITLASNETLLSFAQYLNPNNETNYVCFIINANKAVPKIIPLFTEKALADVLAKSVSENIRYLSRDGSTGESLRPKYGAELYNMIWKPLEKTGLLQKNIYYIPSGLLKTISFAALPVEENIPLIQSTKLYQLTNASEINNIPTEISEMSGLLIGGINYDSQSTVGANSPWPYLPGTKTEINNLEGIFESSTTVVADQATEVNFVTTNHNRHNIIHIASHGFFNKKTENTEASIFEKDPDPMMRSGLVFAGANTYWDTAKFTTNQDGILTSLELSTMNLSTTDLMVMSACETGLGDIEGSEGVYGLQRAVKMAGVQSILMSLWEVPDLETSEFMTLFYKDLAITKNKHDSFINTQRSMYELHPDNPDKWAAFVLID